MQNQALLIANSQFSISRHASQRMAQRSINGHHAATLLSYGASSPAGQGASMLTISTEIAGELLAEGFRPADVDRLRRLKAVISDDGTLITMMHRHSRTTRRAQRRFGDQA